MVSQAKPRGWIEQLEDRVLLTLLGQQLFPSDNPWNQQITSAPVAGNSASIMNAIIGKYGDGRLHPDFGQDSYNSSPLYGIPYTVVHGNSVPKVHVVIDAYPDESDLVDAPIPSNPVLEGDMQNGPTVGLANRGDSHLILWDEDNNIVYEFFATSRPSENTDGQWHADAEAVWNLNADTFRTLGYTSADAAGLPILPGLVRPDEGLPTSQGGQGVIKHAIRFTLQNAAILDQFLYPASHEANPGNTNATTQPPMGARFRLKAGVNISGLNPESRIIAQAMKDYGMILADNGSNFYFSGASYSVNANNNATLTWNDNDIQDSTHGLKSLTFSDFEVVSLTPVVTGLSASSAVAGSQITVTGQNFSGGSGHLQVLFGSTPANSVRIVDDSHLQVLVPAGSGTVDVRVQSGVNEPDTDNINNPIFGYGTSATSTADHFTYSTAGSLSGVQASAASAYNLTTLGSTDWAHWGRAGVTGNFDDKSGGGTLISNESLVGAAANSGGVNAARSTLWTNGTPTASDSGDDGFISDNGAVSTGYRFTVPAGTSLQTLYVYAGGNNAGISLTAHLSDSSSADYLATASGSGAFANLYTITFNAGSASQSLAVTLLKTSGTVGTGSVDLIAAALTTPNAILPAWVTPDSAVTWNATTHALGVSGAATVSANPGTDQPLVQATGSAAQITVNPSSSLEIDVGGVNLSNGASMTVASLGAARTETNHRVLVVGTASTTAAPPFAIDSTSRLDVTDNDLILLYGSSSSPLVGVTRTIAKAYDGGLWDMPGVTSSIATINHTTNALGYAEASTLGLSTFDGVALGANAFLVKYTLLGDSTLKGAVDLSDYTRVIKNLGMSGALWTDGNFDYSGNVNLDDYTKVIQNIGKTNNTGVSDSIGTSDITQVASASGVGVRKHRAGRKPPYKSPRTTRTS